MFAFAMGGASSLAPIVGRDERGNIGEPNWNIFERAYGTVSSLNLGISCLNVLLAFAFGWYAFRNLLIDYNALSDIWIAFGFMQLASLISFIFQRYQVALQGMNYVALVNRWGIIFSILSMFFGSLSLVLGAGIIELVIVMQSFVLLNILRNIYLLRSVEDGRVLKFKQYGFDHEVFNWAWPPTWKGFIGQFGMQGSAQITSILYTSFANKADVASFLFAVKILQTINQFAQAPFSSIQPKMARLMSSQDIVSLRKLVTQRIVVSMLLSAVGVVCVAIFLPYLLSFVDSNIAFISTKAWLLLGFLTLFIRFDVLCCAVSATGNNMVFYWDMLVACILSGFMIYFLRDEWGVFTPILTSTVPLIIILNTRPFRIAKKILK